MNWRRMWCLLRMRHDAGAVVITSMDGLSADVICGRCEQVLVHYVPPRA